MPNDSSSNALGLQSAVDLLAMLASHEVSSVELLDHFVERNSSLHSQLNAVVTLDVEQARASAANSDRRRAKGEAVGVIEGLPMTIKDAIAVKGVRSTGGAVELADHVPEQDAEVVSKIKTAGGIVFGKTNLPRWSGDIQAYNDIFGTTNNPWDLDCGPNDFL